jgi:hypothetical protein
MNWIRNFGAQEGHVPPVRNVEDAPQEMRQELIDLVFGLAEQNPEAIPAERLHRIIGQSLGIGIAGQPYGGFRYASGRDIGRTQWQRIYDLVARLWPEFVRAGLTDEYHEGINRILAGYGVAWDLTDDGHLRRVLPDAARAQVNAAFEELRDQRYAPALALFNAGRDAYDDRPRRDRDACSNIFDAMESVAKDRCSMPDATFGQVIAHVRQTQALNEQIVGILESINTLRNRNFGHGMAVLFNLNPAEVDFTYLSCIATILLFTRTP